ncbi:hypothetical protein D5085_10405 [Ectothiorhodospiraceae bacterium BW-2]|nr:hypothetical protein D5085_10405 [Ectothiorhodospiraceae bacterium BW-2]
MADSLFCQQDNLALATRTYTYRQKLQRAFAAELLCPAEQLVNEMRNDYSDENQTSVADTFGVSPLTVKTILTNHGYIERDFDSILSVA